MGVIVDLPPDLEDRLRARVAAGEFTSLEAAVSEAVRQFDLTQPLSDELRAAVAEGLAQSLRGESAPIDFAELKRELRSGLGRSGG
jgi:Arc/MetJ-type ribon-helix-helix transcriptional regulator